MSFLTYILCILQIEIKRVLESLYGFEVERVETLNMEGKKKKRGGVLFAKPDYKKAYVTLRSPLSINPDVFPIKVIEDEKKNRIKQSKSKTSSIVEDTEAVKQSHWLDEKKDDRKTRGSWIDRRGFAVSHGSGNQRGRVKDSVETGSGPKFPWSSMKTFGR